MRDAPFNCSARDARTRADVTDSNPGEPGGAARLDSESRVASTSPGLDHSTGLLTEREAARLLGLSMKTLARWRSSGRRGPRFIKLGAKAIRYDPAELRRFIEKGLRDPSRRRLR